MTLIQQFSVETDDGLARLNGEFMVPKRRTATGGLLIVPGGWFAERDGFMGDSYTKADLMYRRIANRLLGCGCPVARYDNRGVSGNELTIGFTQGGGESESEAARYVESCIDCDVRRTVTGETLSSDAVTVFHQFAGHAGLGPSDVVVFAHSEGGIHVARAIGLKRINPKGVVFAGTTMLSPVENTRWQMVDRYVSEVMSWDRDGDGRVSRRDVETAFSSSFLTDVGMTEKELWPRCNEWSEQELTLFFSERYEGEKKVAVSAPDDTPYPAIEGADSSFVAANSRWYKQWFLDEFPVLRNLYDYRGHVALHYGEIDRQLSPKRETEFIESCSESLRCKPKVVVHPSRGHAFATGKPTAGPMDIESEDLIVNEIEGMLES